MFIRFIGIIVTCIIGFMIGIALWVNFSLPIAYIMSALILILALVLLIVGAAGKAHRS